MVRGRQLVIAGVVGVACGKAISVARENPSIAHSLLSYSAASAVLGATLGVGVAYYRKMPLHLYGLSVGANFALCSFTFFGMRHVLITALPPRLSLWQQEYVSSTASGGVTGSMVSILSRHGVGLIASTGVGGLLVGGLGQWVHFRFHHWRKKKAVLFHNPHLGKPRREWTLNAFQDWFLGFWHQRSKVLRVESEITLLENDIAYEKQRIAILDRELAALRGEQSIAILDGAQRGEQDDGGEENRHLGRRAE